MRNSCDLAEEARAERAEMGRLRRRATIARKGITQILETAAEYGLQGEEWAGLARETRILATALKRVERPEEMVLGVESLERRQRAARERLEMLLVATRAGPSEAVDSDPKGPENRPHQYTYKPSPNPQEDTVIAHEKCSAPSGPPVPGQATPAQPAGPQETKPAQPVRIDGTVLRLSTDELVQAGAAAAALPADPRARPGRTSSTPPTGCAAISACRNRCGARPASRWAGSRRRSRSRSSRPSRPGHFRTSPGGYFHGMVAKAKAGELNLARTIWGLRARDRKAGEGRSPRRAN